MNTVPSVGGFRSPNVPSFVCWLLVHYFLSTAVAFNVESRLLAFILADETTTSTNFFGYNFDFRINRSTNSAIFLIASPKANSSSIRQNDQDLLSKSSISFRYATPGMIQNCTFNPFSNNITYCQTISRITNQDSTSVISDQNDEEITLSDSLGLTLATHANSDNITACAPLRTTECNGHYFLYGTCYVSENFGNTWSNRRRGISQICPVEHLDLMFLLDGSGSVNNHDAGNFDRIKAWVKSVTSKFNLRRFARVGVIQYSHFNKQLPIYNQEYVEREVLLGQYNNHRDFNAAVDAIEYHGFSTFTAAALRLGTLELMNSDRFNDSLTEKVILLLTDGRSNDPAGQLEEVSLRARDLGITILAVGVADYSRDELLTITGRSERIFGLTDFSQLEQIVEALQRSIISSLEGSTATNVTNDLQQAQSGIDAAYTNAETFQCIFFMMIEQHISWDNSPQDIFEKEKRI